MKNQTQQTNMNKLFSMQGKIAVITGGDGRLGIEHGKALHEAGAEVYSFDIKETPEKPSFIHHVNVDITRIADIKAAVKKIFERHGHIDVVINNAVIDPPMPKGDEKGWDDYPDFPQTQWEKEIAVGLSGAQFMIQAVAPYMLKQKKGSVINVSSTSGITAPNHSKYPKGKYKSAAYPTVKSGLLGLTRAWASYFSAVGSPDIRVNAICLGAVNFKEINKELLEKLKNRNMLGRPAKPNEYGGAIIFLASDASAFMTAQTLIIDGGQTAW